MFKNDGSCVDLRMSSIKIVVTDKLCMKWTAVYTCSCFGQLMDTTVLYSLVWLAN